MKVIGSGGEVTRLRALRGYGILDTPPESSFDQLAALAARACDFPMASIGFLDADRFWLKATFGPTEAGALGLSLAQAIIAQPDEVLEIADTTADPRTRATPSGGAPLIATFLAGVAIVAPDGVAVGALCVTGPAPRALDDGARDALRGIARQIVALLEGRQSADRLSDEIQHRERAEAGLRLQNEKLLESQREASRLLELAEKSRGALLSILEDEQRTGKALSRSNQALKMLSACNEALIWATEEASLLERVCRIAVELGGHRMAFIAYVEEDEGKTLRPVGQWGDDTGYLQEVHLTWNPDVPAGRGPAGRCAREGLPMVCPDVRSTGWSCQHIAATESRGYRSVACLPLRDSTRTFGVLGLYSNEVWNPGEGEVKLLQELADDISLGVTALRSRHVRERAETALLASLREKEALLKEVHHRVKNNLQVIASLLRLESRRIDHPITQSVLADMQSRIHSMALLHETLYRSGNFATVDLAGYLTQLTRQMFRSLARRGDVTLNLDLMPAQLEIDQAIPCGLIVNELASNSLKHGFPPGTSGEVTVRLVSEEDGRITITVSDNGIGLPKDFDPLTSGSLGLQLVTDLSRQIQGGLTIGSGPGAQFKVSFAPSGSAAALAKPSSPAPEDGAPGRAF